MEQALVKLNEGGDDYGKHSKAEEASPGILKMGELKDPVVVLIRHGRTPHNNLGLFTGKIHGLHLMELRMPRMQAVW